MTPNTKRVIDLAYDEARAAGDNFVGTEHLLLAFVREGDGIASKILSRFGLEIDQARVVVTEIRASDVNETPPASAA